MECCEGYYDPETGRFLSADDVSLIQPRKVNGLNLYSYCLNNPIYYVDSTGCSPVPILLIIVCFVKDIFVGIGGAKLGASEKAFAQVTKMPMYLLDDVGGALLNPAYLQCLTKATNLQYTGKILSGLGKVAKVASYMLLVADIGSCIYNNIMNPNLSTSRKITDSIVDVGFSVGSFFGSIAIGSLLGGPVGVLLGLAFSVAVFLFQQSNYYQDLKVAVNTFFTQTIPDAWYNFVDDWNCFWNFNWI